MPRQPIPEWIRTEVINGLSGLYALRLDGTPGEAIIKHTREVWLIALTTNRVWVEQRDAPRIAEAFALLAARCDKWPTPRQLIANLPDPEPQKALPKKMTEADRREGLKAAAKMRRIIEDAGGGPKPMPLLPGERRRQSWER